MKPPVSYLVFGERRRLAHGGRWGATDPLAGWAGRLIEMVEAKIPETHVDILDKRCFGHVASLRPDGELSCNPVSIVRDGEKVRFSPLEKTRGEFAACAANRASHFRFPIPTIRRATQRFGDGRRSSPPPIVPSSTRWPACISEWTNTPTMRLMRSAS